MLLAAHLLGDSGRMPFVGHFRATVHGPGAVLSAAGRVAPLGGVSTAFHAARCIEAMLREMDTDKLGDRHSLLRAAWSALLSIPVCDLGPENGTDITVLFGCADTNGMGIAGVGLGGVWSLAESGIEPMVEGDHPLLGPAGLPDVVPGVLTLDAPVDTIIGLPHPLQIDLPHPADLLLRCGAHA
jgi:hypothetical protein